MWVIKMSASNKVDFAEELMKYLTVEVHAVDKQAVKLINAHAEHLRGNIEENSPVNENGEKPGEYRNNWKVKKASRSGLLLHEAVVYNDKPTYRLTHLLENGHIAANGKRVGQKPHIKSNAEKEIKDLADDLNKKFGGG